MNRPNRRPTASRPIVVQIQKPPAPEAKKLPEWASFTVLVTAVTVFGFTTSNFYVFGLEASFGIPLRLIFRLPQREQVDGSRRKPNSSSRQSNALDAKGASTSFTRPLPRPEDKAERAL